MRSRWVDWTVGLWVSRFERERAWTFVQWLLLAANSWTMARPRMPVCVSVRTVEQWADGDGGFCAQDLAPEGGSDL